MHGIPTRRKLVEGDLVKLDYGVIKRGWYGDSARTVPVGKVAPEAQKLIAEGFEKKSIAELQGLLAFPHQQVRTEAQFEIVARKHGVE